MKNRNVASSRNAVRIFALFAFSVILGTPTFAKVNVLTQHNDNARTGTNPNETTLTPANVNKEHFGLLFKRVVDDQLYTQPLLLTDVHINGGWHDVVYVTTVNNSVYAFDANDSSARDPLWHVNFGTPASLHDYDFGCLDVNGNMGVIGTPVIDAGRGILYVVALTKVAGTFEQRLHALDVSTGADMPNSPMVIRAPEFDPLMENQRPALMLDHGNIYVGYSSHCDKQPYHGFLMSYDAATLRQIGVLNLSPGGEGASIWQSGQAPAVDSEGNIYFSTGNGSWDGAKQFSETFMKVDPKMQLLDWFTPSNHVELDKEDNDVDSSGVMLIPGTHLIAGGGKQGVVYVLDTGHLGHLGDAHAIQRFQATSSHIHSLVFWHSATNGELLYLWGQRDRERVYKFTGKKLVETPFMSRPEMNQGHPGGMLSLSANGGSDGILWAAIHRSGDSWHESRPGILHAFDANNVNRELWNSLEVSKRDDCNEYSKMAPPTVANGKVYLASFGTKNVGTGQMCVYGLLRDGNPPSAPQDVQASIQGKIITIRWNAIPGADYYVLERVHDSMLQIAASGLTRTIFVESAESKGATQYRVSAINANGHSTPSEAANIIVQEVPIPRSMPQH